MNDTKGPGPHHPADASLRISVRLPDDAWTWLRETGRLAGLTLEERLAQVVDAWTAAGSPDMDVPDACLSAGWSLSELVIWRALLWAAARDANPLGGAVAVLRA